MHSSFGLQHLVEVLYCTWNISLQERASRKQHLAKALLWPAGLQQIMAVDVLTFQSKEMQADHTMCNPRKMEDESIRM